MRDTHINKDLIDVTANYHIIDSKSVEFSTKHRDALEEIIMDGINQGMSFQHIMFAITRGLYEYSLNLSVLLQKSQEEVIKDKIGSRKE